MAARKFPPEELQVRTTFSLPPADLERVRYISRQRGIRTSVSDIIREAVTEYLQRRFNPTERSAESERVAV